MRLSVRTTLRSQERYALRHNCHKCNYMRQFLLSLPISARCSLKAIYFPEKTTLDLKRPETITPRQLPLFPIKKCFSRVVFSRHHIVFVDTMKQVWDCYFTWYPFPGVKSHGLSCHEIERGHWDKAGHEQSTRVVFLVRGELSSMQENPSILKKERVLRGTA